MNPSHLPTGQCQNILLLMQRTCTSWGSPAQRNRWMATDKEFVAFTKSLLCTRNHTRNSFNYHYNLHDVPVVIPTLTMRRLRLGNLNDITFMQLLGRRGGIQKQIRFTPMKIISLNRILNSGSWKSEKRYLFKNNGKIIPTYSIKRGFPKLPKLPRPTANKTPCYYFWYF